MQQASFQTREVNKTHNFITLADYSSFFSTTISSLSYSLSISSVTTCLVVLSSRFYFWKNRLRRRNPRRNVMGMTDHRGCLVPKHLQILKFGCWNRLSELCNEIAERTVTGVTDRHRPLVEIWVSELCDDLQDGPAQARRPVTECTIPVWVEFLYTF